MAYSKHKNAVKDGDRTGGPQMGKAKHPSVPRQPTAKSPSGKGSGTGTGPRGSQPRTPNVVRSTSGGTGGRL